MKHFVTQEWVDFVRGAVTRDRSEAMQKHLDSGCSRCSKVVETWNYVLACAQREKSYEPLEVLVSAAKAQFIPTPPALAREPALLHAELVFDSLAQPVAAGIRSSGNRARHLVFRKGNCNVDVRIEPHGDRLAIVGQVLDAGRVDSGMGDIPVRLLAYKQQTTTGRFGEFQFEVEPTQNLELLFVMSKESDLMISIPLSQGPFPEVPGVTVFFNQSKKF